MQFSYAAAILRLTKICRGGVDDTVPSTPVEPGTNEDELLPLELNFGTSAMTKALVEDTVLPTGSSVGITIRDDYGRYTGDDYTNIRYSSTLSAGVQVWETTSPVLLARETGTLFSYWPHSEDEVDGKTITVAATSDVQTDYMWGLPVAVSKSNRTASITMQHALSAVRIYCKRGSYTGAGKITGVAFGGDCAATAGILDLTCGALDDLSGQGTMIAPAITSKTITSSYQKVSDIIVVPTSGTNGKVVVTLDGTDYPIEFNTLDLNPGEMSEFYLTANDGELFASDVTVGDWTYGDKEGNEIVVSPKVKITGDIRNIALHNDVSDDGSVTIYAMSVSNRVDNTTVHPVTLTGDAAFSQNLETETGVRIITIQDIASDVEVQLNGLTFPSSANCYIVSRGGTYCLPAVKGNGTESVGNVTTAEVLWESFGTDVTPNVGDLVKQGTYNDGYVSFCTSDIYREGNAVIAAKDASGTILWSWHIWFTDQPKGQVYYNDAGTMMDRNLGATTSIPEEKGILGLLYQWGRKDPFPNLISPLSGAHEIAESTIEWSDKVKSDTSTGTIEYTILNPTTIICGNSNNDDWLYNDDVTTDYSRWTTPELTKAIYDPCPAGWRVPTGGENGIYVKASGISDIISDAYKNRFVDISGGYDDTYKCVNCYGILGNSEIWYPLAGYYDPGYGTNMRSSVGVVSHFWTCTPQTTSLNALVYDINMYNKINTLKTSTLEIAKSIRCMKD